jgi:hypothetical protein
MTARSMFHGDSSDGGLSDTRRGERVGPRGQAAHGVDTDERARRASRQGVPPMVPDWNRLEDWLWRMDGIRRRAEISEKPSPYAPGMPASRVAGVLPRRTGTGGEKGRAVATLGRRADRGRQRLRPDGGHGFPEKGDTRAVRSVARSCGDDTPSVCQAIGCGKGSGWSCSRTRKRGFCNRRLNVPKWIGCMYVPNARITRRGDNATSGDVTSTAAARIPAACSSRTHAATVAGCWYAERNSDSDVCIWESPRNASRADAFAGSV